MSFLRRVPGLSLRDRVRSSAIREELRVELLINVNDAAALITVAMANKHNGLLTQPWSEEGEGMSNFCVIKAI